MTESVGKLWPQPLPTPLIPIHAITLEGRSDRVQNMWRGWLNEALEGEKKKLSQWLSFEEVCLVQSSERVGKKGASTSSNLSSGDPGGQIGNPVHSLPPNPLCSVRTANRIHAAATVVSY